MKTRYHKTTVRIAKISNTDNKFYMDVEQLQFSFTPSGGANWYSRFGRKSAVSHKIEHAPPYDPVITFHLSNRV